MRKGLIVLGALLVSLTAASQAKTDSLLKALPKARTDIDRITVLDGLAKSYAKTDSAQALAFGKKALALAESIGHREGISHACYTIGSQYMGMFRNRDALRYLERSLAETADKRQASRALVAIGGLHMRESHYPNALTYYYRALKIDESLRDKKGIAEISTNIASVYSSLGDYKNSIVFFDKAIAQEVADKRFNAVLFRNMAAAYNSIGKTDKALAYFHRSLARAEQLQDVDFQSSLLSDIALTYYDMEEFEKAIRYCKRSLSINPKAANDKINLAFCYGVIGDSYTQKAKVSADRDMMLDSAFHYLDKSIALHGKLENIRGLYDDYTSLTEARKIKGDFAGALASFEKATAYKDSIFNSDNRETIKNLQDKRAIEIRDHKLKLNALTLRGREREKWLLVSGIGFLAVIAFLLLYQNRIRRKNNRRLRELNIRLDRADRMKTKWLGILNHDLRSPVNSFIHYMQFRKESPDMLDEAAKERIESASLNSAKNLLESMEDILLWTKDQMENFTPQPQTIAVSTIFGNLAKHFSAGRQPDFKDPENLSVHTDADYLKAVLRNLIANAIAATAEIPGPVIVVAAKTVGGKPAISVSDNAEANTDNLRALFDPTASIGTKSGLGLHLVRDLAEAIGWHIRVETHPGETVITVIQH